MSSGQKSWHYLNFCFSFIYYIPVLGKTCWLCLQNGAGIWSTLTLSAATLGCRPAALIESPQELPDWPLPPPVPPACLQHSTQRSCSHISEVTSLPCSEPFSSPCFILERSRSSRNGPPLWPGPCLLSQSSSLFLAMGRAPAAPLLQAFPDTCMNSLHSFMFLFKQTEKQITRHKGGGSSTLSPRYPYTQAKQLPEAVPHSVICPVVRGAVGSWL